MKKNLCRNLFPLLLSFVLPIYAGASDVITLNNQMRFEGKVRKIERCEVKFKASDGNIYFIPASDIYSVEFENPADKALLDYLATGSDADNCLKGQLDAEMFHGKKGAHILYGALFGPFAMILTAASTPKPENDKTLMVSENKGLFSDPGYLSCYRKKAKAQNIGMEALGWGAWILILLI